MFTGLIQEIATVKEINSHHGDIQAVFSIDEKFLSSISEGDSVSINGVCLTAYNISNENFSVDISNETLDVTTLTQLSTGYEANIETSLSVSDKLGGHIVSGHVDCIAQVINIEEDSRSFRVGFELIDKKYLRYIVKKGSICVDGVSLTVNMDSDNGFFVNIIPFTWDNTNFTNLKKGSLVNLEIDLLARYLLNSKNVR